MLWQMYFPFLRPVNWPYWAAFALALLALGNTWRWPWLFSGLGGFLLGQLIGAVFLPGWELIAVFWLSVGLAAVLGAAALAAPRPMLLVASFVGVGHAAFFLAGVLGAPSLWKLVAAAVAGACAVGALFIWPFDRALVVNGSLSAAGAIAATMAVWIPYFPAWNGWPAVAIGVVAAVVGIVHGNRHLAHGAAPQAASSPPRQAAQATGSGI